MSIILLNPRNVCISLKKKKLEFKVTVKKNNRNFTKVRSNYKTESKHNYKMVKKNSVISNVVQFMLFFILSDGKSTFWLMPMALQPNYGGKKSKVSVFRANRFGVKLPGFLVWDDGVGCIFASLLNPSKFPLIASKASSRLFSPVWSENQQFRSLQRQKQSKISTTCKETHLGFDAAQEPQLLFLLFKLPSFSVLLQHLLLLLQTFPKDKQTLCWKVNIT